MMKISICVCNSEKIYIPNVHVLRGNCYILISISPIYYNSYQGPCSQGNKILIITIKQYYSLNMTRPKCTTLQQSYTLEHNSVFQLILQKKIFSKRY